MSSLELLQYVPSLTLVKVKDVADGEKKSVRKGSYVEKSCLPLKDLVRLSYAWAFKTPNNVIQEQLGK